jgi:sialic acid synthase SpsE
MVFITAEIGTSWQGDLTELGRIMKTCKGLGFDAVKLQAFKREHLGSRYWRLACSVTPWNVEVIDDLAKYHKIKWYCTPIYPEAVDFLAPYIDTWKIRYKDRHNLEIQSKILEKNPKRILISSDMPLELSNDSVFQTLYCIPKYPHGIHEVDWDEMLKFDGWSVHCPSMEGLKSAVKIGMKYLEIHVMPPYIGELEKPKYADYDVSFETTTKLGKLIEDLK